jgi:hypothetical protein
VHRSLGPSGVARRSLLPESLVMVRCGLRGAVVKMSTVTPPTLIRQRTGFPEN